MKLNPPGSSSDLEAARAIAARLSVAAYGRRGARKPTAAGAITAPVEPPAPPLGEPVRVSAPVVVEAAKPAVIPESPQPAPEALAPHEEPPLATAPVVAEEPAPAEVPPAEAVAAVAPEPPVEASPAPEPPVVAETRHDSGSFTLHKPVTGKSRVDVLLQQALGRSAALGTSTHRAEPVSHEPFVPIPSAVPATPAAEPPIAAADEARAEWESFTPVEGGAREEQTNPSIRVPEEIRVPETETDAESGAPTERFEAPADDVLAGVGAPLAEEAPLSREAGADDETVPEPPFGVDESPVPVDAAAFDTAAPGDGAVFDPTALVGEEPAPVEEIPPAAAPEPPPPPAWPEVLERCLHVATTARGVLVAGADGRLIASAGHWPAKAEAIAGKLVPLIEKAPRPATDEPLPIKLGPNVLSSWQFPVEGERYTAAFIGEAALPGHVWPELKATLRR